MPLKWLEWFLPRIRDKRDDLQNASISVSLSIHRYCHLSQELQEIVRNNNFAKYLIYEKEGEG
ncbi:hypothetical protein [Paenibacillus nasutitermitis]|uniref:Uncharacterized protein n=1 Tax=Paenibacillus nasutitermitis TaxID=1652958 RepID=A0A916ZFW7_9BACL|nr:hypothetical protein [Paenibacillus nasutitermitis]GGD95247.1 hypothetical protein GCM10010911_62440 [Paenibacillus nasutitermitis]